MRADVQHTLALIDSAAHDMTAGQPEAGFASRVLDRLDAPPARVRSLRWWPAAATLAATAATLLVAAWPIAHRVVAPHALPDTGPVPIFSTSPTSLLPRPPSAADAERAANAANGMSGLASASVAAAIDAEAAAALAAWEARAIPALDVAPPLVLDDLATPAIQPAPVSLPLLTIDPLPVSRVVIAPLGTGRDGASRPLPRR